MADKPEKGFYYEAMGEGEDAPLVRGADHEAAIARPEHSSAIALLNHDLVIKDKRGRDNRFMIKLIQTYPTISKQFQKAFSREDFERLDDEAFVLNFRGNVLFNVVADARNEVVICVKKIVPVEIQRGVPRSQSPGKNIQNIRRHNGAKEVVEEIDGMNLMDAKNPVHLVSKQTLDRVRYCIFTK